MDDFWLKAMLFYHSTQKMSADKRNNKANQQEARNCSIVGFSQQETKVSLTADLRKILPMVIM